MGDDVPSFPRARRWRRPNRRRCSCRACRLRPSACGMWVAPRQETAFTVAEQIVEHVAPVAEHVDDDAAAVFLAVVPGRALRGNGVAFEDPVAELAAHAKMRPKKPRSISGLQLQHARQPELVLHHAVLHAGLFGQAAAVRARPPGCRKPASRSRCACRPRWPSSTSARAAVRRLRVEVDGVVGIGQHLVQIGGPGDAAAFGADGLQLGGLRPTRIGSGMMVSLGLSLTPPCWMMAQIERRRCWFIPMRPVTPFMMMPTEWMSFFRSWG